MANQANVPTPTPTPTPSPTTAPTQYAPPNVPLMPPTRDPAAVITELMRRCMLRPQSRDENAYIDLHKGLQG
jgi:hypothetical protein